MSYRVIFKQYKGSIPVKEEGWRAEPGEGEQIKNLCKFPVRIRCRTEGREAAQRLVLEAEMMEAFNEPVSLALEYIKDEWKRTEYVFMPGAVYDGNRMHSRKLSYPPYHAGMTDGKWDSVITDIPHLDRSKKESQIQFRSGDMTTPAMGYFDQEKKNGEFILAAHRVKGEYTGFTVKENEKTVAFIVSVPAVREGKKYFFGELPDGSGFYPTCDFPSDDEGILLKKGERLCVEIYKYQIQAQTIPGYLKKCNELRDVLEQGRAFCCIPFSAAYDAVKEKYQTYNYEKEGYYRVGTENEAPPSYWQAGWVGGGMNTCSFIREDHGLALEQSLSTLKFIVDYLQQKNGWYVPMYAKGKRYGDNFQDNGSNIALTRKNADLLFFLLKQAMELKKQNKMISGLEDSIRLQAEAFVRFFRKNGELGQFVDTDKDELLQGGTACAAIAPAALALAYEYFKDAAYLDTAEALGEIYDQKFLQKGLLNGGPGEICQAPDSESAFAFLESCVQLYETTQQHRWLTAAEEAFELAVTWVMSYDFHFPENSTAARLNVHTRGTVFANAQNKHSAPGICTLSGNSMLKLYRFTGNTRYLTWMSRISHALPQFVSLENRPVYTLAGKNLPPGYFNERVQTCDWEGKETVGEFLYGSNWPEVTMLLTYTEVPGIYVDMEKRLVWCSDHVEAQAVNAEVEGTVPENAEPEETGKNGIVLKITNPSCYDARVTVLADGNRKKRLGHLYFSEMELVEIKAGEQKTIHLK
ncbi:hypothetical protein NXH76_03105 [Blautia schinkii]|nr:hypothetical protein [Blautia schinkii]